MYFNFAELLILNVVIIENYSLHMIICDGDNATILGTN